MTRDAHLAWAKARALELVDLGRLAQAGASVISDLSKHEGTRRLAGEIAGRQIELAIDNDPAAMRAYIERLR